MTPQAYRALRAVSGLTAADAAERTNAEIVRGARLLARSLGWAVSPPELVIDEGPRCQWLSRLETGRVARPDPWITAALVAVYTRAIDARKDDRA